MNDLIIFYLLPMVTSFLVILFYLYFDPNEIIKLKDGKLIKIRNFKFIKNKAISKEYKQMLFSMIPVVNILISFFGFLYVFVSLILKNKLEKAVEEKIILNYIKKFTNVEYHNKFQYMKEEVFDYIVIINIISNERVELKGYNEKIISFISKKERDYYFLEILHDLEKISKFKNLEEKEYLNIKEAIIKATKDLEYINRNVINEIKLNEKIKKHPELKIISENELQNFKKIKLNFEKKQKIEFENENGEILYTIIENEIQKLNSNLKQNKINEKEYFEIIKKIQENMKEYEEQLGKYNYEIEKIELININSKYKNKI